MKLHFLLKLHFLRGKKWPQYLCLRIFHNKRAKMDTRLLWCFLFIFCFLIYYMCLPWWQNENDCSRKTASLRQFENSQEKLFKKWNDICQMLKLLALRGGITNKFDFFYCFSVFAKFCTMAICCNQHHLLL